MAQSRLQRWIESRWYSPQPAFLLLPLQPLYVIVGYLRRQLYRYKLLKSWRAPVPVLVVGNLSVGGTGKTPLTIALVSAAQQMNLRVGVVSRGYGRTSQLPQVVSKTSTPAEVGDEPLLVFQRTHAPVAVASRRSDAAQLLLAQNDYDLLIADDGLQHYALQRDAECVVVDSLRGFGNGWQLPAGPLREPLSRLKSAAAMVVNERGGNFNTAAVAKPAVKMQLFGTELINLMSQEKRPLADFNGQTVTALAGIGNPAAFYNTLREAGLTVTELSFPDHHHFVDTDLPREGALVLMTEKDAVKVSAFRHLDCWYLPVSASLPDGFAEQLIWDTQAEFNKHSSGH